MITGCVAEPRGGDGCVAVFAATARSLPGFKLLERRTVTVIHMASADLSGNAAIAEPTADPRVAMLASLTREGKIVAAFASAHASFHRHHEAALHVASSAISDPRALEQLREILDEYVKLFHEHHDAEEVYLFPALRRVDPMLDPAVDRLRDQHEGLTEQINSVARGIDQMNEANAESGMPALVRDLMSMHALVVEHLRFEEAITVPVISTWTAWPF